ncbi:hypothetical protein ACX8Z9_09130 [Arthrobacter halodurans]|uniref:Uncharacterized protein n=1 Tax=Arthrobacter halodurans TaxID=516699 RepID=A0ABV4UL40_9MICC
MKAISRLMAMPPMCALIVLVPSAVASAVVGMANALPLPSAFVVTVALVGLIPSTLVFAWGTMKFRSYYEIKRGKAELWAMFHCTVIQILAVACTAYLFVLLLESADSLN